jgi:NAD(P) transhydrogenase subunit alpha
VPGKPAPKLLTSEMVEAMRPGSVVVDLAAEAGGNCELTEPGEVVEHQLVAVHGPSNLPSQMPIDASRLYSRNVVSVVSHLTDDEGQLDLDFDDEITDAVCLTHGGEVRSQPVREALGEAGSGS